MKKKYETPKTMFVVTDLLTMVCASGDIKGEGTADDITYGGVDEEGVKDPASRKQDVWEDDEDENAEIY
ncbi:MAG: hypothetical protein J6E29_01600 [Prevotella sp.]|nr:hypothetical protein [Prevotella sp.]